jgi:hypothetical protein
MRAPIGKMKKADRGLRAAFIYCLLAGFAYLIFTLRIFLKHEFLTDTTTKPVPIDVYHSLFVVTQVLVYLICPCVAASFFFVGYLIWNYRRKRGAIEDHDKSDA